MRDSHLENLRRVLRRIDRFPVDIDISPILVTHDEWVALTCAINYTLQQHDQAATRVVTEEWLQTAVALLKRVAPAVTDSQDAKDVQRFLMCVPGSR